MKINWEQINWKLCGATMSEFRNNEKVSLWIICFLNKKPVSLILPHSLLFHSPKWISKHVKRKSAQRPECVLARACTNVWHHKFAMRAKGMLSHIHIYKFFPFQATYSHIARVAQSGFVIIIMKALFTYAWTQNAAAVYLNNKRRVAARENRLV